MDVERSKQFLKEYEKEFMFSEIDDDFNRLENKIKRNENKMDIDS
jgi:hypothetical protein